MGCTDALMREESPWQMGARANTPKDDATCKGNGRKKKLV